MPCDDIRCGENRLTEARDTLYGIPVPEPGEPLSPASYRS